MRILPPDESLPSGVILLIDKDELVLHPLINWVRDLHDLQFSLKDKLLQARQIVFKHKKTLIGFFSKGDILILKQILKGSSQAQEKTFLKEIIHKNKIYYHNNPGKNIKILCEDVILKQLDRANQKFISTWMTFDSDASKNNSILENIKSNTLYTSFSDKFNDIFDAQLRCSENLISELAEKYVTLNVHGDDHNNNKAHDIKCKFIKFYQNFFNSSTIKCFSKVDPLDFSSHHMWGLYGGQGKGFALQYDLASLSELFIKNTNLQNTVFLKDTKVKNSFHPYDYCKILPVNYESYTPFKFFEEYLEIIRQRVNNVPLDASKIQELINSFFTTKNLEWKFEQEVRMIFTHFCYKAQKNSGNKVLDMNTYLNDNENDTELLDNEKQNFYTLKENIVPFIKPVKIIVGWNYNVSPRQYMELSSIAQENGIEIIYLDKAIDYTANKFVGQKDPFYSTPP